MAWRLGDNEARFLIAFLKALIDWLLNRSKSDARDN